MRGPRRPCLFLDRDGVVNMDDGYVGDPARLRMTPWAPGLIAAANAAGAPVVLVTNQSGIARGYYGWGDFARVQDRIHAALAEAGARLDLVLACAYHEAGAAPLDIADHPMRKPNPGMLRLAARLAPIARAASVLLGDQPSDAAAAARAGLASAWLVKGSAPPPAEAAALTRSFDPATDIETLLSALGVSRDGCGG